MTPPPDDGLPPGWRIELDRATRRTDAGRVLVGGTPFRLLRLSAAGARLVDRLAAGEPVPDAKGARALARRLVDASLAHPWPDGHGAPSRADVSVVIPVRDQPDDLRRTIAALGAVGEVVVVDDGSADPAAVHAAVHAAGSADPSSAVHAAGSADPSSAGSLAGSSSGSAAAGSAAGSSAAGAAGSSAVHAAAGAPGRSAGSAAGSSAGSAGGNVSVLRHERACGPAAARNTGWRAATGPVVAFVDADVVGDPGWLDVLLAHLGDVTTGAVAPRVRSSPGAAPAWLAAYEAVRSSLDLGPVPALVRPGGRVPYVPTACLVVRREALVACDGFDEDLVYGEDVDLIWRLHGRGWRVRYEPAATLHHPSRPDLRSWLLQRYRYGTSAADLADRHGDVVAPLGTSGWSALAWGAVVAGHPLAGATVAGATTAALVPKLRGLEHPAREAVRIAGIGHLWAGRSVADALRRPWWPVSLLLAWRWPRARPALVAAATLPTVLEWRADAPALDPVRYGILRLLDDLAYGAGVWAGSVRRRTIGALRPRFTGPIRRPARADDPT